MALGVNITKSASITKGSLTLADLRELVEATQSFSGSARVRVSTYAGDMRENGYSTITVQEGS